MLTGVPMKTLEQNFENFPIRGHFSKKKTKIGHFFPSLATLGHHNSTVVADRRKFIENYNVGPCPT